MNEIEWTRRQARHAIRYNLVPFVLPLLWFVAFHVGVTARTWQHIEQIVALVASYAETSKDNRPQAIVASVMGHVGFTPKGDVFNRKNYEYLLHSIVYRINTNGESPTDFVKHHTWYRLGVFTLGITTLQVALIMFFPGLLISVTLYAKATINRLAQSMLPEKSVVGHAASFHDAVAYKRSRHFLEEEGQRLFWLRFGFAWLMAFGSMYIFAPGGLSQATVAAYVFINAPPTEPSLPIWLKQYEQMSPFLAGFFGFLLYSLTVFLDRYRTYILSHRILISLLVRGLTVTILCIIISAVSEPSIFGLSLAFIVGIFPQTGIEFLAKIGKATIGKFTVGGASEFAELPEIDLLKETSLAEVGIRNQQELAKTDLEWLMKATGINAGVLLRATDRAILLYAFGTDLTTKLAAVPIFTATEFVQFLEGDDAYSHRCQNATGTLRKITTLLTGEQKRSRHNLVAEALGVKDVSTQLAELQTDANVITIIDYKLRYHDV